ncbi:MAG: hypothetical protein IGS54_01435 [Elainella sp. C42_A2020_010]|nr:hypothetical protein [Elainella sp. C42_A2020_010]
MMNSTRNTQAQLRNRLSQPILDTLSRKNRVDVFNVNLPNTSQFRASLKGISRKANVDLELVNQQGVVVAASRKPGKRPETLEANLDPGNYKLRAILKRGQQTRYRLSFSSTPRPGIVLDSPVFTNPGSPQAPAPISPAPINKPDLGGNSSATATPWGKIGSSLTKITDVVGGGDDADWYSFSIGESGFSSNRLNLALKGDAGVYARVYSAGNFSNPVANVVAYNSHSNPLANTNLGLAPGNYFVKVGAVNPNSKANYNLDLSATPIADNAGHTKETALVINNLQPLNTSGQSFSFTDYVGHGDIADHYTFKTSAKTTLSIKFERLGTGNTDKARIHHQLSKIDGLAPQSLFWKNSAGASISAGIDALTQPTYELSGELEPGTYMLNLKSYFADGDNSYRVTLSTSP